MFELCNFMDKRYLFINAASFLSIRLAIRGVDYKTVHRSQPIVDNLSPDWPEERLYLSTLCYGDTNRTLHLSVYDYDKKHGNHELMGGAEFTLASLVQKFKRGETSFEIQKKCKVTGKIILHWAEITYD